MVDIRLELRGDELYGSEPNAGTSVRRLSAGALARLKDWTGQYDRAVQADQPALLAIGRDIAAFLNDGDRWLDRSLEGTGAITLEIIVSGAPGEAGLALLAAPWELLAWDGIYLAADDRRLFRVARRLGRPGTPRPARHRNLALIFMAADVDGERVLDYEREEQAILDATRQLDLNLVVEESGCLEFLERCLIDEQPEALHLSCHGTIVEDAPVLALETPDGRRQLARVGDLRRTLGEEGRPPVLVFLSACRSAEHATAGAFTQSLIGAGIDNAVGWDGSVYDVRRHRLRPHLLSAARSR